VQGCNVKATTIICPGVRSTRNAMPRMEIKMGHAKVQYYWSSKRKRAENNRDCPSQKIWGKGRIWFSHMYSLHASLHVTRMSFTNQADNYQLHSTVSGRVVNQGIKRPIINNIYSIISSITDTKVYELMVWLHRAALPSFQHGQLSQVSFLCPHHYATR
jgi:hypothetical protein